MRRSAKFKLHQYLPLSLSRGNAGALDIDALKRT
jgi:hypothetical protein